MAEPEGIKSIGQRLAEQEARSKRMRETAEIIANKVQEIRMRKEAALAEADTVARRQVRDPLAGQKRVRVGALYLLGASLNQIGRIERITKQTVMDHLKNARIPDSIRLEIKLRRQTTRKADITEEQLEVYRKMLIDKAGEVTPIGAVDAAERVRYYVENDPGLDGADDEPY